VKTKKGYTLEDFEDAVSLACDDIRLEFTLAKYKYYTSFDPKVKDKVVAILRNHNLRIVNKGEPCET